MSARARGGDHRLQAGQTSQPPRLGLRPANFLLGFLRPRGVSTSFLLPPLQLLPLTCAGTEVCITSLQNIPLYPQPDGSHKTVHQSTLLPRGVTSPAVRGSSLSSSFGSQAPYQRDLPSLLPPPHSPFQTRWLPCVSEMTQAHAAPGPSHWLLPRSETLFPQVSTGPPPLPLLT